MPIPIDSYGKALTAYAKAAGGSPAAEPAASGGMQSFADMLKGAAADTIASGSAAEQASVAAVGSAGGADLGRVVTAVAEAEVALQTVIAVRERVIEAYKEILRMPM